MLELLLQDIVDHEAERGEPLDHIELANFFVNAMCSTVEAPIEGRPNPFEYPFFSNRTFYRTTLMGRLLTTIHRLVAPLCTVQAFALFDVRFTNPDITPMLEKIAAYGESLFTNPIDPADTVRIARILVLDRFGVGFPYAINREGSLLRVPAAAVMAYHEETEQCHKYLAENEAIIAVTRDSIFCLDSALEDLMARYKQYGFYCRIDTHQNGFFFDQDNFMLSITHFSGMPEGQIIVPFAR